MIHYLLKIFGWWLLSIVKFLVVPFAMILKPDIGEHWNWLETVIITGSGASMGVYIFYHFGDYIFKWISARFSSNNKTTYPKQYKKFIRIKNKWGLKGLMFICGLISVPIAAMLAARLFRHDNTALPKLILAFWVWALALSTIAFSMKKLGLSF